MKLYKTLSGDQGNVVTKWSGTQADARADRKEMKAVGNILIETEEVEVPTNKADLLKWLNKNAV